MLPATLPRVVPPTRAPSRPGTEGSSPEGVLRHRSETRARRTSRPLRAVHAAGDLGGPRARGSCWGCGAERNWPGSLLLPGPPSLAKVKPPLGLRPSARVRRPVAPGARVAREAGCLAALPGSRAGGAAIRVPGQPSNKFPGQSRTEPDAGAPTHAGTGLIPRRLRRTRRSLRLCMPLSRAGPAARSARSPRAPLEFRKRAPKGPDKCVGPLTHATRAGTTPRSSRQGSPRCNRR
jgi:hypothetical protein